MKNIFSAVIGFILSVFGGIIPVEKSMPQVQPTITVSTATPTFLPTPTEIATPSATMTISPAKKLTPVPTAIVAQVKPPTPTMDLVKNEECNHIEMPIYLFSGHACLPKANITPEFSEDCRREGGGNMYCYNKQSNWDPPIMRLDLDNVRNRLLAQCRKVSKGDFLACNASVKANGGRLQEEMGKGIEGDVNSCISSVSSGNSAEKSLIEVYLKRNKLKERLEYIFDYCYSHGFSVNDLHF